MTVWGVLFKHLSLLEGHDLNQLYIVSVKVTVLPSEHLVEQGNSQGTSFIFLLGMSLISDVLLQAPSVDLWLCGTVVTAHQLPRVQWGL